MFGYLISVENQAGLKEAVLSAPVPMRSYVLEILNKEIIDNAISASNRSKSSSIRFFFIMNVKGFG